MSTLLLPYGDVALLLMRLLVALIFGSSGWSHLTQPEERSKSISMSKSFTIFLGAAELAGALGLATGILARWAALGLTLVMFGAVYKKAFVWNTGFWGKSSQGWHYDVLLATTNLVILTLGPGRLAIPLFTQAAMVLVRPWA